MSSSRRILAGVALAGGLVLGLGAAQAASPAAPAASAPAAHAASAQTAPPDGWPKWPASLPTPHLPSKHVTQFGYGSTPSAEQIAGWAIAVAPDGAGLPPGHGNVDDGGNIFSQKCAVCHGTFGEGEGNYPKLATGSASLKGIQPTLTVGNYWPFATTLWDYINRAMPFYLPHSLKPNEVYAITAYILNLNNVVPENFVADQHSLPLVKMPNRHGFIWHDPRPDTHDTECMHDCRQASAITITSTAEGKPLTPRTTGPLDEMQPK
ncbi:MAG: cytochrome c [Rhodospirillales bacterium]|nr:cytochrome c [Rhodospirillales bacterium]